MPTYDFQCNHCQKTFEVRASFQEKEQGLKPMCPTCKSMETHQILTAGMFFRKGKYHETTLASSNCGPNAGSGCCG